jgi:hypothetical protein
LSDQSGGPAPETRGVKPGTDPAKARFWFIAGHRLIGAVLVILGILAIEGALGWGRGVGKVLAIVGLIDFFVIPLLFARLWKSVPR